MRRRILAPLAVLVLVLASAATAAAATGVFESNDSGLDSPRDLAERGTGVTGVTGATSPTTISLPDDTLPDDNNADNDDNGDNRTETQTSVVLAPGATQTFAAGDAGSVTIRRDGAALTVLSANAKAGFVSEIEQGTGTEVEVQFNGTGRVDFNAELEDGAVRVRVRVSGVVVENPGTIPTTVPDNNDNVDNSGPGNAGEDNSGPGNVRDGVDDDRDDNSGSGSGSSGSGSGGSGSDDSSSGHSGSGSGSDESSSGSGSSGSGSDH